jgi:protein-L-isoaspartate(D-aspartate) O-methyltransferase
MANETPRSISAWRRFYSEELRVVTGIESTALCRAFAQVPREQFLGPPPWLFGSGTSLNRPQYRSTSRIHDLYHDIVVALDPERKLNTAQPSLMARMIDALGAARGQHVLHLGCSSGYYTAILATIVGQSGSVTALEIDEQLAESAAKALRAYPQANVQSCDAACFTPQKVDAILVNAGVTHLPPLWLQQLRGTLVAPFFVGPDLASRDALVLRIARTERGGFSAEPVTTVAIYPCTSLRDEALQMKLRASIHSR